MKAERYTVGRFTVEIEYNGYDYRGCDQFLVSGQVTDIDGDFWTKPMRVTLGAMCGGELELAIMSLSVQPGDTDEEFFEDMSEDELKWRKRYGDELSFLGMDLNVSEWASQIEYNFDWQKIKLEADANEGRCFLGTVMGLFPSGKYYTTWADSNVTEYEARVDNAYREGLESVLEDRGFWLENGENDPCDVFAVCEIED